MGINYGCGPSDDWPGPPPEYDTGCRHLGGIESWDTSPPKLICCDCGEDISEQTAT